ncbi:hypothetical protein Tco_0450580 [Tanacetum coccineum]
MTEQQTIKYAPQWTYITMDNVLSGNYSSTEQVNSIQQLLAYSLIIGTEVDIGEIIYSDLVTKLLNKSRLKYVSYPRFISCALQVLLGSDYTQDKKFSQKKGKSQTVAPTLPKSQGPEALGALSKKRNRLSPKDHPLRPRNHHPSQQTGAKYQEDQTQSSRLRYQSLTKNKGKPSYEGEPDTQPILLTYVDVRVILLSEDEAQESDEEPEPSNVQESASDSSSPDLKKFDNILPLTERQLIRHLRKIDQTDKLVEAFMSSLDRSSTNISDLYKGLNVVTHLLKEISNTIKDDPATNQKPNEATETFARISSNVTEDTFEIKSMMAEMYAAFQGHSSSAPSGSVTLTLALTNIQANVEGSQATLKIDKVKGISTESGDDPLKKLVKASSIVHPDPDKPVIVEFIINGRKVYLTEQEIQDYWDKEEQIKKVEEEARLNAISKSEVIKVVREEAKKLGIYPKEAITTKAGELFKKAQDVEHEVLKKQHTEKVRKYLDLRKHKGTDGRNFDVHKPFLFGAFGISELDELREIIPKKKNTVVKDLMNSLSRRDERLRQIPRELGIQSALPAPEQTLSQILRRKLKHMKLEPKTRIPGLECNRALPENVPFVNNMVIEEPEY